MQFCRRYSCSQTMLDLLVKNMYIIAVFSSNDFYSFHFSVMERVERQGSLHGQPLQSTSENT